MTDNSDQIVKVQLPLFTNNPSLADGLVYDKQRRHQVQMQIPPAIRQILQARPDRKGYFQATWTGTEWVLHQQVADKSW